MLRRHFLANVLPMTVGAREVLDLSTNGADEERLEPYDLFSGGAEQAMAKLLAPHFRHVEEYDLALNRACAAVYEGWTEIGVWGRGHVTVNSLVGVNPKTGRVDFLPRVF